MRHSVAKCLKMSPKSDMKSNIMKQFENTIKK